MFPEIIHKVVTDAIDIEKPYYEWDLEKLRTELERGLLEKDGGQVNEKFIEDCDASDIEEKVLKLVLERYSQRQKETEELDFEFSNLERMVLLRMVDINWMSHIEDMQIMKNEIFARGFGNQDPVLAYKKDGFDMFDNMIYEIKRMTCYTLLNNRLRKVEEPRPQEPQYNVIITGKEATPEEKAKAKKKPEVQKTVVNQGPKIGRNDPCPCGSGKKYKNCHGKNVA